MFAGRIEESKGVFDILAIAERLPHVEFALCGDGSALQEVRRQIVSRGLQVRVKTYGRLNRTELLEHYLGSHIVIVPTRSSTGEAFAMVVAEAVLLLRPVVTSRVVAAAELLDSAVVLANTDDVQSYVDAIEKIRHEPHLYQHLVDNARILRSLILDNSTSFQASLHSVSKLLLQSTTAP
jgi:glycosyltransferase involved in cell wall biosynthesis